jgi:hypothetical protein
MMMYVVQACRVLRTPHCTYCTYCPADFASTPSTSTRVLVQCILHVRQRPIKSLEFFRNSLATSTLPQLPCENEKTANKRKPTRVRKNRSRIREMKSRNLKILAYRYLMMTSWCSRLTRTPKSDASHSYYR